MDIHGKLDKAEINRLMEGATGSDAAALSALWQLSVATPVVHAESMVNKMVKAQDDDDDFGGRVSVYDDGIEFTGFTFNVYDKFKRALKEFDGSTVNVRINSPGGNMGQGAAVYSLLRQDRRAVNTIAMGNAGSAASLIFMAGEERIVGGASTLLIHEARSLAIGRARDLREFANILDSASDAMAELYSDRAGGSPEKWRERMSFDNLLTGRQSVKLGLATSAGEPAKPDNADDNDPPVENDSGDDPETGGEDSDSIESRMVFTPYGVVNLRTT